jgi:threonine synthase
VAAYKLLARKEGIFGEPASAAAVAGLIKMTNKGLDLTGKKVVCIITGTGLKDPSLPAKFAEPFPELPVDIKVIEKTLGWS